MGIDPRMHLGHRADRPIKRGNVAAEHARIPFAASPADGVIMQVALRDRPKRRQIAGPQCLLKRTHGFCHVDYREDMPVPTPVATIGS
jgi:hypothetical protein